MNENKFAFVNFVNNTLNKGMTGFRLYSRILLNINNVYALK
jgi:hypothetical protein